jgi:hypothetical protein
MNIRLVNLLWWESVENLTKDDLILLKEAFEVGLIPLGDEYGDHNPKWVEWKNSVKQAINSL